MTSYGFAASETIANLPKHEQPCVFVDSTQQIIAAASGTDPRDRRTKRKRTTAAQLDKLVASFAQSDSPDYDVREELAAHCDMTNREVQVWFQNRRAKVLRERQKAIEAASPRAISSPANARVPVNLTLPAPTRWRPDTRALIPARTYEPYPTAPRALSYHARKPSPSPRRAPPTTEDWRSYWRQRPPPVQSPSEDSDCLSPPESTPSLVSPGAQSASSGYFSICEPTTPLSAPSPTDAFFRLALDSPQAVNTPYRFDQASHSARASGLVGSIASSAASIESSNLRRLSRSLEQAFDHVDEHKKPSYVQSAPASPTSSRRPYSHRTPSLRNLLNPEPMEVDDSPAEYYEACHLTRSLSDGNRPRSPPPVLKRPPLGRRLATFDARRLPTIVSCSPSLVDDANSSGVGSVDWSSRRTSVADASVAESSSGRVANAPTTEAGGLPAATGTGLGILAAAAQLVDSA
ncbi:hypothetical protein JCM10908_001506 [Rhodotorula pacifica]|uniref:homeobox domain-containing protein n=1 Tax=Rhodotorula pacifica TaxID=1495444 RepID=UPI00317B8EE0